MRIRHGSVRVHEHAHECVIFHYVHLIGHAMSVTCVCYVFAVFLLRTQSVLFVLLC